jgi:hypothetical protein
MAQEFVQAHLLDLGDARDVFPFRFMALEPWITGKYEKFTSNAGHIAKDSDLAQAYSHFTWEFTSGEIMVADIQGVGNTLTDPQIHSLDDRFGRGNLQHKGHDAGPDGFCFACSFSSHEILMILMVILIDLIEAAIKSSIFGSPYRIVWPSPRISSS